MIKETRIALKNLGKINPESIDDYISQGGYLAFAEVLEMKPTSVIKEIEDSGLRGRGGAGFPTGIKDRYTTLSCEDCDRYIICNADEGEPGTFKDRIIMENDPHLLIEGMLISAYGIGASKGYIYIRAEYYLSVERVKKAIETACERGYLGKNIMGTYFSFYLEIKLGAGSYLCGEELTLMESLEGKRGYPRIKPPFPAEKGLFGKPTLINNVETLSHIPTIIVKGSKWYTGLGTEKSKGTKIFTISGNVNKPGYYEVELGVSLRSLIYDFAGGMKEGKTFKAALLGGAAGTFVDESMLDTAMAYDSLKEKGATLGSGAIIVLDNDQSVFEVLFSVLNFFKHESCGKCVPCRIGTTQLMLLMNKIKSEADKADILKEIFHQSELMAKSSLCPLGQSPILPVKSSIKYFEKELLTFSA
ncbi:MAG: NADH-quinone oxidoreductase subunit NuoF [Bacteroidetes bacterium]|nr:NADH-quinone oxidoreductase subunit NuoF [Bacteroidota bacterium]